MADKQKYIGEAPIKNGLKNKFKFDLSQLGIEKAAIAGYNKAKPYLDDLQNQIDSLQIHGLAVSNMFGNDPHIGMSQKALTEAFNRIWSKIADITGETYQGISMTVFPTYFIGDNCTVVINASLVGEHSVFEELEFYWNIDEEPFVKITEPTDMFSFNTEITETTVIRCRAKILGLWYEEQKIITHYDSLWLGTGSDYSDVMVNENLIPLGHHMRGAYDVVAATGQHIIIVMADNLAGGFIRADINGLEIQFTESTVTVDNIAYRVYTSVATYEAGTYNVDING